MLENYRKRMSLYGGNINEAMMNMSNDIKDMVFDGTTTYKRVRIGKHYYDARVMRDIDASVNNPSPNFVIQFRGDKTVPIGTYIYIPNDEGVEEPWMMVSDKADAMFPKNCILQCTYRLRWLYKYKLIEYPVALRTKNSYTDGVRQTEDFNLLDNQSAFWIPFNEDSSEITYNMRFLISRNPKHPQAYTVSKINDVLRPGIVEVMLIQDQLGEYDNGEMMCADYDVARWNCNINVVNTGKTLHLDPDAIYPLNISGSINDMPVDISYFTFASSNPDAVMVDKYGVLTAVAPGQAEIAIQLGNALYKIAVTVSKEQQEQSNMELIDPAGDYVLRLRFEKELLVAVYQNGVKVEHPTFQCELLEGADFASFVIESNKIILSASPALSNIGKTIRIKVSVPESQLEVIQDITVKGVI